MKRTTGLCLVFGLLAAGGLFALFVLPSSSHRPLATDREPDPGVAPSETVPPEPPEPRESGAEKPAEAEPAEPPDPEVADPLPGAGTITGRVIIVGDEPVPGALVYWTHGSEMTIHRDSLSAATRSGEDGSFELSAAGREGALLVRADGYRTAVVRTTVFAGEETDVGTISLDAGFAISGRIVDTDGQPVAGADAVAWRHEAWAEKDLLPGAAAAGDWGARATSDERGEFGMTGLSEGRYGIRPEGLGIVAVKAPAEVPAGAANVTLVVRRIRVATGLVVPDDDRDGAVAGATVSVALRTPTWGQVLLTKTDEEGRFMMDLSEAKFDDPDLRIGITITAPGFEDHVVEDLAPSQVAPSAALVLRLVRAAKLDPGRLSGRVLYDTGDPFTGRITLSFSRDAGQAQVFRVETDEDGNYEVTGIRPGEYQLRTAPRSGRVLLDTGKTLVVPPGGEEHVDLTIPRGGDVKLTLLDARGDAIDDLEVEVFDDDGEELGSWTGPLSGYVLPDLPPGDVRVRVSAAGFVPEERVVTVVKDDVVPLRVVLRRR